MSNSGKSLKNIGKEIFSREPAFRVALGCIFKTVVYLYIIMIVHIAQRQVIFYTFYLDDPKTGTLMMGTHGIYRELWN